MQDFYRICYEKPYPLGCYIDYDKSLVVRAVFKDNKKCGITLYPAADNKKLKPVSICFSDDLKRGAIYSARIKEIPDIDQYVSYNYFCDESYFCDSYAKHVIGLETFGKDVPDSEIRAKLDNKSLKLSSFNTFDWENDENPRIAYEDSFIYLVHVRGYTKSSASMVTSSKRGTFGGILEKIPYLKSLGVTTLELMPVYEMNEVENPVNKPLNGRKDPLIYSKDGSILDEKAMTKRLNFWGYKRGYYFAPRTAYCEKPPEAENEFKNFVKILHQNNIEVVLQFYFEENENDSLIIDVLRYWRCTYHVDGFHLKGARLPIRQIVRDPLFTDVKLWHDWFDTYDVYGSNSPKNRYLAFYNDSFMFAGRRFLKSDDNTVNDFLRAMIANGIDHAVINYICNYEGFRLADLVAYEHKHNEENGENNKDGTDNNLSWNCGIEGRTRKHVILQLRNKQIKNVLTMLFMASGVPMLFGGDEFCNSQSGNNNPYCQDNETGWVDWKAFDKNQDVFEYVKFLSEFRRKYSFIHGKKPFKLMDYISCGYPDLSCHGKEAWRPDLSGYSHILGMLYCGLYDKKKDQPFIYVCYNMHWKGVSFALPKLPDGLKWTVVADTGEGSEAQSERSVRIYLSAKDENYKPKKEIKRKKK